jgi:hypothetical protein
LFIGVAISRHLAFVLLFVIPMAVQICSTVFYPNLSLLAVDGLELDIAIVYISGVFFRQAGVGGEEERTR